jgi:hypothetical protein
MKRPALVLSTLAAATALGLAACGGGGSGTTTTATGATGTANVQITDGPSDEFQHVWVTITKIAFHTDPNATWNAADAHWIQFQLPAPVTVDLTTLNNGVLNPLFSSLPLPAGTYRQIRFFFDGANASLDTSAYDTYDSNGSRLQWNDQVEYLNGRNSWAVTEAPLEIAYPTQGIQLTGTFDIAAGSTLNLAVDFDLEHIIVPFLHGTKTYFTMRPNLFYFDMSKVGAINGSINPAQLCTTASSIAAGLGGSPSCAFNLIVKAELLSADGSRHYVARETSVDPISGKFTLYPLATQDANGNAITSYDVLIRGREMQTMLVTGVPVTAGTSPGGTGSAAPTSLQSTALPLHYLADEYTAQLGSALAPLTGGYAIFQQTLPGTGAVPYEVRWRNTDPITGVFANAIPLQGTSSSLYVAPYNGGNTMSFQASTPQEGAGAFTVADNEVAYYSLAGAGVMAPVAAGGATTFLPSNPTLLSGVQSGTVNFNLTFTGGSVDNSCQLVLSRFAAVIDTVDCTSLLNLPGGGPLSMTGVPAGEPGAYYYAYVRLWNATTGRLSIAPIDGMIDLRTQITQPVNGTIPGA